MGKSVRKVDPFAYKPEYGEQLTQQAAAPKSADDPFAFKPEYNSEVKKKVGGNEFQIESPSPSQLYSESPSSADFVKKDIEANNELPAFDLQGQPNFNSVDKRAETQKLQQTILSSPETLQGYTKSRIETLNNNIKELELSKRGYRRKIDMAFEGGNQPERSWYDAIKQIDQTVKQRHDYVNQLKGGVADVVADMVVNRMEPGNFNPREYGKKITEVADPDLTATIRMAEKNGGTLPGILSAKMERMGLEAAKKYLLKNPTIPDAELLSQTINNYEKDFDTRNVDLTAQRVREKIGAQLYKEGKSAWFGFGYSPETLQRAINDPATNLSESEKIVAQENVLPTERKIIGTNIPSSGFTRSLFNAVEKSAINTGKSIGAMTGIRDESQQAQELLNTEVEESRYRVAGQSPSAMGELEYLNQKQKAGKLTKQEETQKKELENYVGVRNNWSKFKDVTGDLTGQVLEMALLAKGLGGAGRLLQASGAEGGLLGGMTRTAVGQALSNETVGLFVGGYLNSYDSYKKQAIELMPGEDQAAEREAYAKVMAGVEGLSEQIFKDTKVLGAITKEVAPTIRTLTNKLLSQEITQAVAREELQGLMAKTIKPFMKDALKADVQESTEEAVVDIAQGIADSVFTGKDFDAYRVGQQALNTFLTTAMGGGIISGLAAHGAMKQRNSQNAYMKSAIMDMGANPAPYLQSVEDLQLDGTITQNEANEKIKLIKSSSNALNELPTTRQIIKKEGDAVISEERPFDYPELNSYLIHRLNEGILTERIKNTTDEVLKSQLEKDLKRSQDIRKGIYDGSLGVTGDLQEVTDNPEKAQELGIADASQLPPQELIGTPFAITPRIAKEDKVSNELTDNQQKEAIDFVAELVKEGVLSGVYAEAAQNNPLSFLKDVAQQAQNINEGGTENITDNPEAVTREVFGDAIVDYAIELFPASIIKAEPKVSVTFPKKTGRESTSEGVTVIKPEPVTGEGITVIQPTELSKPDIIPLKTQTNEEVSTQETIPEKGNQETGGQQEGQDAGQENDEEGDVLLTEQGAEPEAEAPLELTEEEIQKPLEQTRAKKVSGALRDFATKIQKADITGAGGTAAQSDITRLPRETIAFAINRVADAIDAGEAVVNAIQKGVDYIREQGHKMDDDSFKNYTTDLISGKKPRIRISTEPRSEKQEETEETDKKTTEEENEKANIEDYKMTTSDKINRFMSGDTWEDVFGEQAQGDQTYIVQSLSDMLQDGRNMIAIAQQRWGGDVMMYGKPLFQMIQQMSNDAQLSNKKAVLLATFLGELQEAKLRSPERAGAINQLEKPVFAYYQNYMNVRGKEVVAGRLLRLYRDKYIGDIFADRILEGQQVKEKNAIRQAEQKKQIDDETAAEGRQKVTKEQKVKEDKAAKEKSTKDKKRQDKKKKSTPEEAKVKAEQKLKEIEAKIGADSKKGLLNRIKDTINKLNCK